MTGLPLLSLVVWTPIAGGLWVLLAGAGRGPATVRAMALAVSLATFGLSLLLWAGFDAGTHEMQFVERAVWISAFDIHYHLGVDGISLPLVLLTTLMTVLVVLAGWAAVEYRPAQYMAAFLIQAGLMAGAFSALDSILFYVFWEALLIPMFLVIGIWGGRGASTPPSSSSSTPSSARC